MTDTILARAIELSGGAAALAKRLGITSQAISQWRQVPPLRVLEVEAATGKSITRHDLRPDLYPVETSEIAPVAQPDGPSLPPVSAEDLLVDRGSLARLRAASETGPS